MLSKPKKRICPSVSCKIWLNMRRQLAGARKGNRPSISRTRASAIQRLVKSTRLTCYFFVAEEPAGAWVVPRKIRKKSDDAGSSTITSLFLLKLAR